MKIRLKHKLYFFDEDKIETIVVSNIEENDSSHFAAYQVLNDFNREKKDTARAKLCLSYLIFFIFRIHQEQLKELTEQISQCIPREIIETYYVPYKKLLNKKSNAKGKVYNKYEPFEDVKARWEATHEARLYMLRNTQSTQTIFDYINDFSVLQLSTGYILLLSDFNKLYSDYDLHMWSKWPSFPQKICTLLKLKGMCVLYLNITKIFYKIKFMIFCLANILLI
ncbi:hypothetical protein ACFW04_012227 [Cataglyphis niger]